MQGHNMTVVEADGHYVEPFEVKNLFIYSGETYSVLVKTDQDPSRNYWITSNVVSRNRTTPPGLGMFNYYPNHPKRSPPTVPPSPPAWDDVEPRLAQSLSIIGLHSLAFKRRHVLNFKGLHALTIRGLRVLTLSGPHIHTLR